MSEEADQEREPVLTCLRAGYSLGANGCRVIAQVGQRATMGPTPSALLGWERETGWRELFRVDWTAVRVHVDDTNGDSLIVGPSGFVGIETEGGAREEEIDASDRGPRLHGHICDMCHIENHLYVAGMDRQVYRRETNRGWTRFDHGALLPLGISDAVGFRSIHGITEAGIYAVGHEGEIWHCRDGRWRSVESPTNLILNDVCVVRPELIYIAGQMGLLLVGHDDEWEVIEHRDIEENIWDMAWFGDRLFIATSSALYVLDQEKLVPVDTGLGENRTYQFLHVGQSALWSFGTKHVAVTKDAFQWEDIPPPLGTNRIP